MRSLFFVSNKKERVLPDDLGKNLMVSVISPKINYFSVYPEKFDLPKKINTYQLLKNQKVKDFIKNNSTGRAYPLILVFKNSNLIERYCKSAKYKLLAPSYKISDYLENKITQSEFLEKHNLPRPLTIWGKLENLDFYRVAMKLKLPFILQFGRGHSGLSSFLIKQSKDYFNLVEKYPLREVKCSKYFQQSEVGTINICLTKEGVVYGAPSLQLTGIKELTPNELSTVGNDWVYIKEMFKKNKLEPKFKKVIKDLAKALRRSKYQGVFGIDFLINPKDKQPFKIVEINARFPASTVDETNLAVKNENPILAMHHIKVFLPKLKFSLESKKDYLPYYNKARVLLRDKVTNEEIKCKIFEGEVYLGDKKLNPSILSKLKERE